MGAGIRTLADFGFRDTDDGVLAADVRHKVLRSRTGVTGVMHSKPDTPILPILQHSIFLLNSLYPMTPIFPISTSQRISSCQAFLSRPFGIAVVKIFSRQDAKQSFTKSEIRSAKSETNPKNSMPIVKSETSLFGTLCSFDHLELFRLSDFELRVFSAFLPINRKGRWLPRRINAAETLHSAFEAIEPLLRLPFQFWIDRNSRNS